MDIKKLSNRARQKRNEYQRKWRAKNRDKIKEYNNRYWEKQVNLEEKTNQKDLKFEIMKFYKEGYSLREIAKRLGMNHMKVKRVIDSVTEL